MLRHKTYDGFRWNVAAGVLPSKFITYVSTQDPTLFREMTNPGLTTSDSSGAVIDVPHLAAVIDGYLSLSVVNDEWNGWAGDIGTVTKVIQRDSGNSLDFDKLVRITDTYLFKDYSTFGLSDLYSDVDGENIAKDIQTNTKVEFALIINSYYANPKRFTKFVNRRGGNGSFLGKCLDIANNPALYLLVTSFVEDVPIKAPTFNQIYAITGTFANKILTLKSKE